VCFPAVVARLRTLLAGGSDGNARLTGTVAVVLLVLLAAEGLTILGGVRELLLPHIFIGLLLIPPIALKLASVGWRMLSYYRRIDEYVRKGPPHVVLRILVAPVLSAATIVVFASGIGAALVGHGGLLLGLHKASFVVWGIAFGVHVLAHVSRLPGLVLPEWWSPDRLGGRRLRSYLVAFSLVTGVVLAIAAIPLAHHWHEHHFGFDR
jgi:hypothetical protein